MIKFFRKIRQKLLSENKISKYLIYAVGEIILVVIGILIALQVNNWNINRINYEKETFYLQNLKIDLKNQSREIDKRLENAQEILTILDTINSSYRKTGSYTKIEDFNKNLFQTLAAVDFELHINTFNELNSTGQIALIDNDKLRATILSTFQNVIEASDIITNNYKLVFYPNAFPVISSLIDFSYPSHLSLAIENKLNNIDTELKLSNAFVLDMLVLKVMENELNELKPKVTELISLIESEIVKRN